LKIHKAPKEHIIINDVSHNLNQSSTISPTVSDQVSINNKPNRSDAQIIADILKYFFIKFVLFKFTIQS
jgi:hypothetical protein